MRIPFAIAISVLTSCGAAAAPPPTIGNRAPVAPPGCPADANPYAAIPPANLADDCARGEPTPLLSAPAAPPTCHAYQVTGPTSAIEAVTLADGRRVWLHQGGCVHATLRFRGRPARPVAPAGRAAVIAAGAALLADLGGATDDRGLDGFARDLAAAAPAGPTGRFPIGSGDWFAEVEPAADGTIAVELDFPL